MYWKGQREYEYLNLYVKKSNNALDKEQTNNTLLLAEQIRAQRIIDLQSGKYKMKQPKSGVGFLKYFNKLKTKRLNSQGNYGNWDSAYKHILIFTKEKDLLLEDIAETWLNQFKDYLLNHTRTPGGDKCDVQSLKKAFLFSILTGLRWSDIVKMTWSEIRESNTEGWHIRFQQKKTKDLEALPITDQAREILGSKGEFGHKGFCRTQV